MRLLELGRSYAASVVRGDAGLHARRAKVPDQRLELYEFEGCPFCKKVRDALSELELEVLVKPCPKGGVRHRPEAKARGATSFPYLVDPNAGVEMGESDDILAHLFETYGEGLPLRHRASRLNTLNAMWSVSFRLGRGTTRRSAKAPAEPLRLWSYEWCPYARLVRERLCELELEHVLCNVPRRGVAREAMRARTGRVQVPYLEDPNTGAAMFESRDIVRYLMTTYAVQGLRV